MAAIMGSGVFSRCFSTPSISHMVLHEIFSRSSARPVHCPVHSRLSRDRQRGSQSPTPGQTSGRPGDQIGQSNPDNPNASIAIRGMGASWPTRGPRGDATRQDVPPGGSRTRRPDYQRDHRLKATGGKEPVPEWWEPEMSGPAIYAVPGGLPPCPCHSPRPGPHTHTVLSPLSETEVSPWVKSPRSKRHPVSLRS